MHVIAEESADDLWRTAANLLLDPAEALPQTSRAGDTVEALHVVLELKKPSQRWVSIRTPAMNPAFALVEAFWIASGRQDAGLPTYWNPSLPQYCGKGDRYHGAYGHRLRRHLGIDQLDRAYAALRNNPDSRQAVLQIWDSTVDLPMPDGTPANQDIPCNLLSILKVRNGRLEWMQVIRSNDLFLGLPHNIVQFTILQEMFSGWLGVEAGSYHQLSDSLHIYAKDIQTVEENVNASPGPESSDSYEIDRETWDSVMSKLMHRLDIMTTDTLTPPQLRSVAMQADLPIAYDNALLICAADSARRRGWSDVEAASLTKCTNPMLIHLYSRWEARVRSKRNMDFALASAHLG
jgi:thymidylate synthase